MGSKTKPVMGVIAPSSRPTLGAAFWLASFLSVPVCGVLFLLEALWRWVF